MKSLALVVWVLAAALSLVACADPPRPTDAVLIERLRAKMPLFLQLIAMIEQDRDLERVDIDWTKPDDPGTVGVSPERIATYRKLMKEAGVPRGFSALKPRKAITFIAYASGLFTHGWAKSYIYVLPGSESERYGFDLEDGDLDGASAGQKKFFGYRHIEGNWYLLLESY